MSCQPPTSFIRLVSHADVAALQRRLGPAIVSTDNDVRACKSLDTSTRAAWGLFYVRGQDWVRRDLSWYQSSVTPMHEGEAIECDLIGWQKSLSSAGCQLTGPGYTLNREPPGGQGFVDIAKYTAIAVTAVAAAWGLSLLVPLIPLPRHKAA